MRLFKLFSDKMHDRNPKKGLKMGIRENKRGDWRSPVIKLRPVVLYIHSQAND